MNCFFCRCVAHLVLISVAVEQLSTSVSRRYLHTAFATPLMERLRYGCRSGSAYLHCFCMFLPSRTALLNELWSSANKQQEEVQRVSLAGARVFFHPLFTLIWREPYEEKKGEKEVGGCGGNRECGGKQILQIERGCSVNKQSADVLW